MFDYASQKPLHKYTAQFGSFRGAIEVFKEGVVLHNGARNIAMRSNYVQSVIQKSSEPFSKVGVELSYYDVFGNLEKVAFQIRETDFKALRQDLGK